MRFLILLPMLLAQAAPAPEPAPAPAVAPKFTSSLPKVPPPSETVPTPSLLPAPLRMETDDAPTAHSCTFARAIRGEDCTFEGVAGTAEIRDNTAAAYRAGAKACAAEARKDAALRTQCENEVTEISSHVQCARPERLADSEGNLTADAEECVESLRAAVARVQRVTALSRSCCTCLSQSHCSVPVNQCTADLADLSPRPALRACIAKSCDAACSAFSPSSEQSEQPSEPAEEREAPPPRATRHPYKT